MAPTLLPRDASPMQAQTYKICLIIACTLFLLTLLLLMRTYYKYRQAILGWDRMTGAAWKVRDELRQRDEEIRDLELAIQHVFVVASDEEWEEQGFDRQAAMKQIRRTDHVLAEGAEEVAMVEMGRMRRGFEGEREEEKEGRASLTVEVGEKIRDE